jgi:hypothetical protein
MRVQSLAFPAGVAALGWTDPFRAKLSGFTASRKLLFSASRHFAARSHEYVLVRSPDITDKVKLLP